jgi:hypothetical protein
MRPQDMSDDTYKVVLRALDIYPYKDAYVVV